MSKRTGKPRGRPPKSDIALVWSVRHRPEGQSIEEFCEQNAERLGGDADSLIKRYHRIVSEYPPDHVFEAPGRVFPWVKVKARVLLGGALLSWKRTRKPPSKG
jgi:hypothetical protein